MGGNRSGHCYLRHNRYVKNSFTVVVKRDAQGVANVLGQIWCAQLFATAAGPVTRVPNSDGT